MSASDALLSPHWRFYSDRSEQTHQGRVDDFGYGREELLSETLALIEAGVPFTDNLRRRLDRIPRNRSKKYRRLRIRIFQNSSGATRPEVAAVELAEEVQQIRAAMAPDEWKTECRLAAGEGFAEVARDLGVTSGALKVQTSRRRRRIRERLAG